LVISRKRASRGGQHEGKNKGIIEVNGKENGSHFIGINSFSFCLLVVVLTDVSKEMERKDMYSELSMKSMAERKERRKERKEIGFGIVIIMIN